MQNLTCPKCRGTMHSYERNGIHIEQCADCRGLFLDRGELEHLLAAEARWNAPAAPTPPSTFQQPQYGSHPHKRRKSFLEELFD